MLNKKDFITCMRKIKKSQRELEKFVNDIGKYFDNVYIFDVGDQLIYNQIEILKIAMNDTIEDQNWIDWFIYDNDWGSNGLEAGYDKEKPVFTLDDLYKLLIEAHN
jgi:hypothetical protein